MDPNVLGFYFANLCIMKASGELTSINQQL
jgi:hypothetical protein